MILTTHALIGAAIGSQINNPWAVIGTSLALHFAADHLRHGEYLDQKSTLRDTAWKAALDIITGIGIATLIVLFKDFSGMRVALITLGIFFSMLPDLFTLLFWQFKFNMFEKLYRFHADVHRFPPFAPERKWNFRNARNDILISLLALVVLLFSR